MTDELSRDDEALSALIDGALPADATVQLRRRIAEEPALAARFTELQQVDLALRRTYGSIAVEPLPSRVVELARRVGRGSARPRTPLWNRVLPHAATAALALAAGIVLALFLWPRPTGVDPFGALAASGTIPAGSALQDAFEQHRSGDALPLDEGRTATPRLTFRNLDGSPCRRVDVSQPTGTLATLACRRSGAWRVELVAFLGKDGATGDDYRPAAGGDGGPIETAIDAMIEGAPLDRKAERVLLVGGWK